MFSGKSSLRHRLPAGIGLIVAVAVSVFGVLASTAARRAREQAVKLVTAEQIDVVLMDIRMPKMNGVEALREIKRVRPATRVVLFTASAAQEPLAGAERYGATRVLKKPVDAVELLSVLDGLRKAG